MNTFLREISCFFNKDELCKVLLNWFGLNVTGFGSSELLGKRKFSGIG